MRQIIENVSTNYPWLLREIDNCPNKIYVRGNKEVMGSQKMVAIVGSREVDDYSIRVIGEMVKGLVGAGWTIVSGLALGVDALVARSTIEAGGKAIAVIPGGVGVARPKANSEVFDLIIKSGGAIVSEDENGTGVNRESFLRRNRIVAGMSKGIVVISGRTRSGTLNTAAWGGRLGREVMAVPGRVTDELSGAPNWLLKNGAGLVTNSTDVLEILNI
jgi:DNA processing protein